MPILESITDVPNSITSTGLSAAANILDSVAELEIVSQEVTSIRRQSIYDPHNSNKNLLDFLFVFNVIWFNGTLRETIDILYRVFED